MLHPPSEHTSLNKTIRKELNPFLRGVIIGWYIDGAKKKDIQRTTGVPYSTINTTIVTDQTSPTGTRALCTGRVKNLTEGDKEFIHILVKQKPYITIGEIYQVFDKPISTDTVSRMLKESGYTHAKAWIGTVIKWVNKPTYAIQWVFVHKNWAYEQRTKIV